MSKSLLDLLNKTRGDIASKRGNNVDLTRLKDGNNYLRIFPVIYFIAGRRYFNSLKKSKEK